MTNTVIFDRIVKTIQTEMDNSPWQIKSSYNNKQWIVWVDIPDGDALIFHDNEEAEAACDRLNTEWVARKVIEEMRHSDEILNSVSIKLWNGCLDAILVQS